MKILSGLLMSVLLVGTASGAGAELTRDELGRTVKFKLLVDKTMQPEAGWHTKAWMVEESQQAGFNVYCPRRARTIDEVRQVTEWCDKYGILHIPWMRGTRRARMNNEQADGKRMVWASGGQQPLWSPNSDHLWEWMTEKITSYARISAEMPTLFGVFLDFENYATGPNGGNGYSLSYDDVIMNKFAAEKDLDLPELALDERYGWLKQQGLHDDFEQFQVAHWRQRCRNLRQAVDAIDPTFRFCIYPAPGTPFMVKASYDEWATQQAPLILADAVTYGRRSVLAHGEALKANRNALSERQQQADSGGINMQYIGGIDPVVEGADPEFCGRNATMISQVTDGYWVFYEGPDYNENHPKYFKWFTQANETIDEQQWQWAWQKRQTPDTLGLDELDVAHPDRKQLVIYGAKKPFMETLRGNDNYELHDMGGTSLSYLSGADIVILQNFNHQLSRASEFVQTLQDYVQQGGGLMLVHDTAWFMASPFPDIALRGYPTHRVEAVRHVVETDLIVEDVPHPAVESLEAGAQFSTEFRDHMIFDVGDDGNVVVRNEFGDPVYVAGEIGDGRVVFAGSYYGYDDPLSGTEADVFWSCVDWLAGDGA